MWPCSPSDGTRLELDCAKVGLTLVLSAEGIALAPGGYQKTAAASHPWA